MTILTFAHFLSAQIYLYLYLQCAVNHLKYFVKMFRSKSRGVIITQFEHARFSYQLASLYGNEDFDVPNIPIESFLAGVLFHDRGYGIVDEYEIGQMSEDAHVDVLVKGGFRTML